jgi:hypothetical protein
MVSLRGGWSVMDERLYCSLPFYLAPTFNREEIKMSKYNHNQICTKDSEIEVGKKYQYYESLPTIIADVKVLEDNSDEEYLSFKLKVLKDLGGTIQEGEIFHISAAQGHYAYAGMWRLYDLGTYA